MWPRGYWPVGYWPVGYWPGMQAAPSTVKVSTAWLLWYYFSIQGQISHILPIVLLFSEGGSDGITYSTDGGGDGITYSEGGKA